MGKKYWSVCVPETLEKVSRIDDIYYIIWLTIIIINYEYIIVLTSVYKYKYSKLDVSHMYND